MLSRSACGLEENLRRQLNDAVAGHGAVQTIEFADAIAQTRIAAERGSANVQDVRRRGLPTIQISLEVVPSHATVHIAELCMVEDVECFHAQLNAAFAIAAETEVLEERQVGDVDTGTA